MREIKFRAWDDVAKVMRPWSFLKDHPPVDWEQKEVHLMQYTGLLDKNGKEIYEGDVVIGRYTHYDPCQDKDVKDEKMGGIVFWDLYQWSFKVIEKFCDSDREGKVNYFDYFDEKQHWGGQRFEEMEIIGNIYENPELLDSK